MTMLAFGIAAGAYAIKGKWMAGSELKRAFGDTEKKDGPDDAWRSIVAREPRYPSAGVMRDCRDGLGRPPRHFSIHDWFYLHVWTPVLLSYADPLRRIYRKQGCLRRDGVVVWGHIVQANDELYSHRAGDRPACVIYSPDPWFDDRPHELAAIASNLRSSRGTQQVDPQLAEVIRLLDDQYEDIPGLKLPSRITANREVYLTSMIVFRKHLPSRCLANPIFPLLISANESPAVLIAPSRYWPPKLAEVWS